jgi:hypothetical protein
LQPQDQDDKQMPAIGQPESLAASSVDNDWGAGSDRIPYAFLFQGEPARAGQISLKALKLPRRALSGLAWAGIERLDQLLFATREQIQGIRHIGPGTVQQIENCLERYCAEHCRPDEATSEEIPAEGVAAPASGKSLGDDWAVFTGSAQCDASVPLSFLCLDEQISGKLHSKGIYMLCDLLSWEWEKLQERLGYEDAEATLDALVEAAARWRLQRAIPVRE